MRPCPLFSQPKQAHALRSAHAPALVNPFACFATRHVLHPTVCLLLPPLMQYAAAASYLDHGFVEGQAKQMQDPMFKVEITDINRAIKLTPKDYRLHHLRGNLYQLRAW